MNPIALTLAAAVTTAAALLSSLAPLATAQPQHNEPCILAPITHAR